MPRLVQKTAHDPIEVEGKFICMCGLSKNQPFCDGSHQKTTDEDESKLYWYNEKGQREEIETEVECSGDCCHKCCQEDKKEN